MDVHENGLGALGGTLKGAAITIGNFDGVHLGHARLIEETIRLAKEANAPAAALTFWPHPARVLAPARAPLQIASRKRRRELLAQAGLDALVEQPFDRAFAALSPEAFEALLFDDAQVGAIVVGYDFTYGSKRAGTVRTLAQACKARGIDMHTVDAVTVDGLVVSSSKVREFVLAGNVTAAQALLGRPFEVEGEVVRGAGRGRRIGVPTANVRPDAELVPAIGVYAVRATLADGSIHPGVCNVGVNPTFRPQDGDTRTTTEAISVEAHVLGIDEDLYGQSVRLQYVDRIRAERRFPGVDALVAQIHDDIRVARSLLGA